MSSYIDEDLIMATETPNRRVTRSCAKKAASRQCKPNNADCDDIYEIVDSPVDDTKMKKKVLVDGWLEMTLDEDDLEPEVAVEEVKALWFEDKKIERFPLRRTDPLLPIFKHYAELNKVDPDRIQIQTNIYKPVHQYDSIETLNLKITNFLIASLKSNENTRTETVPLTSENSIKIKCQFKSGKPLSCLIHPNQPFSVIAKECADKFGCNYETIKLYFDGDPVEFTDTPKKLNFEDGECIDVVMA